jgi:hypothetical protein
MQRVRTELRSATDLAAKAAGDTLSNTSSESLARQVGTDIAALNLVNGQPLTLAQADIVFGRSTKQPDGSWDFSAGTTPKNAVQVHGSRASDSADGAVPTFFGTLYGHTTFEPEFQSVAAFVDTDICIVLDRSGSMKLAATDPSTSGPSSGDLRYCAAPYADSRWMALDAAIQTFVTELQTTIGIEHVAMVTFASDFTSVCGETNSVASVDQDLTSNLGLISAAMSSRSTSVWNGRTDIKAGVELGHVALIGPLARPNADKVMIVFTDGQYTEDDPVPAGALASADGITVHTITFSPGASQQNMQDLANAGNGQHFHADTANDLDNIFRELAASMTIIVK